MKFVFGLDPGFLHFHATRPGAAVLHPRAVPGSFQSELWRHDVTEFFLADPSRGQYLEVNLAPNGAWWACLFRGPRQPIDPKGWEIPGVSAEGALGTASWEASIRIPIGVLRERLFFGPASRLDATFIINSPQQSFLCASTPSGGDPDFHRPAAWPPVEMVPLEEAL
ncbi:MAG: hypothetical protein HKN82_18355 [Akkermansiaceae bacterium]|nr:hypothetical protein [Akkermansiaceae bacterium]NNM28828.1 hypothetical protein [Akkermansiaceae bacterium]